MSRRQTPGRVCLRPTGTQREVRVGWVGWLLPRPTSELRAIPSYYLTPRCSPNAMTIAPTSQDLLAWQSPDSCDRFGPQAGPSLSSTCGGRSPPPGAGACIAQTSPERPHTFEPAAAGASRAMALPTCSDRRQSSWSPSPTGRGQESYGLAPPVRFDEHARLAISGEAAQGHSAILHNSPLMPGQGSNSLWQFLLRDPDHNHHRDTVTLHSPVDRVPLGISWIIFNVYGTNRQL